MFTGLIEEIGTVKAVEEADGGINLTISSKSVLNDTRIGDSISIDGACQTVTGLTDDSFTVFASKVTCGITTLGSFTAGRRVNLERAMSANARLGGHFVQGHVDCKGKIKSLIKDNNRMELGITVPEDILKYIVAKGSVAVDGISLTVVSLMEDGFTLYIIPETVKNTTLFEKTQGAEVNIEADILAKYVERMMNLKEDDAGDRDQRLKRTLLEQGFI